METKTIPKTLAHDEGAYAQCGYCRRYSANPKSLGSRPFHCDCGRTEGWSGSFKKPDENSVWSVGEWVTK